MMRTRFAWCWLVVIFLSPLVVCAEEPAPACPPPAVESASESPAPDEITILGPRSVEIGRLAVFTLPDSIKDASWTVIPPTTDCVVDSNQRSFVMTSDVATTYHIVVAILGSDSKPKILVHECSFVQKGEPNPNPNPDPKPDPEPKNITEWIQQNFPADKKEDGKNLGNVYADVANMIDHGTIQSLDAVYSQVRNGTLKAVNVVDLKPFLEGLEAQIQKKNASDVKTLREVFLEISNALKGGE